MFAFIILHYLAEEMTKECVKYIENHLDINKCKIIIVDNASSNGSGQRLKEYYENTEYCDVILSNENVGFARGNNIGFKYAKEKYDPDYMIIMNNDVLIDDNAFFEKIENIHNETEFDVLGPDIISQKTGFHQNPFRKEIITAQQVQKEIVQFEKFVKSPKMYFVINKFKSIIRIRTRLKKIFKNESQHLNYLSRMYDPVLHGACYIFSKKFIDNEIEAFDSRTFLFHEEDILYCKCMNKKYCIVYDPVLKVTHLEDVSTDESLKINKKFSIKSEYNKNKFLWKNLLDSKRILLKVINEKSK